ncbi:MAG: hypothetical protein ACR2QK_11045 [Acidimicrobiales bacterium]
MFDDFDLPGLDDLMDLLGGLADLIGLDGADVVDWDQSLVELWPDGGAALDLSVPEAFWGGLESPPLDHPGFAAEFGNMQFPNPFAGNGISSPIEDGSYDDFLARTAVNTGIPIGDLPN